MGFEGHCNRNMAIPYIYIGASYCAKRMHSRQKENLLSSFLFQTTFKALKPLGIIPCRLVSTHLKVFSYKISNGNYFYIYLIILYFLIYKYQLSIYLINYS